MCGACETNMGKIENACNIYSDLKGKKTTWKTKNKTSTKIGLKARGFQDV
jgi:hypothetical protein